MAARLAFWSALFGFISLLLLVLLGGAGIPGYSHAADFISELGATGAPHEMLLRFAGFLPGGIFMCTFVVCAFMVLPRSSLTTFSLLGILVYAMGYVAAAFYPCDAGCMPAQPSVSQVIHNIAGLSGYVLAPVFLLTLGLAARRWPGGRFLVVPSHVCAGLALLAVLTLAPESPYVGVSQRLLEASVWTCVLLCAWYIRLHRRDAAVTLSTSAQN